MVRAIPEGYNTITMSLVVSDAEGAIAFYKRAFGVEELYRMPSKDGRVLHAELKLGNSVFFVADEFESHPPTRSPATLGGNTGGAMLYFEDVEAAWARATKAGCKVILPLQMMFWGDKFGSVADPFGHSWSLAQHVEDLSPEEMAERAAAAMAGEG